MTTDWQAICDKGIGWAREGGNNNAKGIGGWFVEEIIPLEPRTVFLTNIIDNITLLGVFPKSSNMHLALHPSHSNYKIDLNNLVTLSHTTMDFDTTFSEDNMLEKSN